MMNRTLYNNVFLKKVFNREVVKNIVQIDYDTNHLNRLAKVDYAISHLQNQHFNKGRIFIECWEDYKKIVGILNKYHVQNFKVLREYREGSSISGCLHWELTCDTLNLLLIKHLLIKLYDYDYQRPHSLNLTLYIVLEKGEGEMLGIRYFDDRGFREYHYISR